MSCEGERTQAAEGIGPLILSRARSVTSCRLTKFQVPKMAESGDQCRDILPERDNSGVTGLSRPVVCVVIPTLNESGTIGALIDSLEGLGAIYDVGIVVVDDGSTDGTVEIVRESGERYGNLELMERGRRLGLGTAIRDGLRAALEREPAPDFVVTMDGDLSHDPGELPSLVEACGRDSLAVGSRYVEGGGVPASLSPTHDGAVRS